MGKGKFLMEMAKLHPEIHYIGIEKYSSVCNTCYRKNGKGEPLDNIHFLRMDAEYIQQYFEKGEVEEIYLNFSDPWPRDRHAKRRLTSRQFLARYKEIKEKGKVIFKTDNRGLFDFSLEEVKEAGWTLDLCTFDLHHSEYLEGNVMTEYEEKFVAKGNPICKMVIH